MIRVMIFTMIAISIGELLIRSHYLCYSYNIFEREGRKIYLYLAPFFLWNSILKTYLEHHDNASILIPIGGLRVIRNMLRLSNGRMLLLSGKQKLSLAF